MILSYEIMKLFMFVTYDNYDGFQHFNIVFSPKNHFTI